MANKCFVNIHDDSSIKYSVIYGYVNHSEKSKSRYHITIVF